ncbi:MAG: metallophosphoesterase [Lachnospiraceae bacterium]|nr:metallophosphoesterase [Lachnospiraceae bacterium]
MTEIARILVYGDLHLCSKNYGAHKDYPKDSLNALKIVTDEAKKFNATHIVGLGDFTYGRFNNLEYRSSVEKELNEQYELCKGNRYEIKGNHDSASYGVTEYEYYLSRGLFKSAENLTFGNVHITMVNFGEEDSTTPNIVYCEDNSHINIIFMHNFFKFKDTNIPNYGKPQDLDDYVSWFGVDYIVSGHIHTSDVFDGLMTKEINGIKVGHRVLFDYPGSMSRPAYLGDATDKVGHIVEITVYDDSSIKYDRLDIELPSIEETFNVADKEAEKVREKLKGDKVDISDIVHNLDTGTDSIGKPEDIIRSLVGVPEKYINKALQLLEIGQS